MKNFRYGVLFLAIVGIGLVSCKKNSIETIDIKENISNNKIIDDNAEHMLINTIALLSKCDYFKEILYHEIEKTFDGDYNTLLNTINHIYKSNLHGNEDFNEEYESIIAELNLLGLFPQIYIPNYDFIKNNKSYSNSKPIYIINTLKSKNTDTIFNSIFINTEGNIEITSFLIDEEFANENEVWIISFNERVNEDGYFNETSNLKAQRIGVKSEYMLKINCPDLSKIEGWFKGAPELRLVIKSPKGVISDQFFYPNRRNSINNTWWTVNSTVGRYLYYWDIETYSKTTLFTWIEVDNTGTTHELSGSFIYKDINKETGQEFTATTTYKITKKTDDKDCGSMTLHIDDGKMGDEYNTGLVKFITSYK